LQRCQIIIEARQTMAFALHLLATTLHIEATLGIDRAQGAGHSY
jgi:hypothetical protein